MSKCVNAVRLMSSTFHYISHLLFLSNLENYLSNCTCNRHPRSPKETGRHTGRRMKDQLPPHRSWITKIEKQIINTYNSNKRQTFLCFCILASYKERQIRKSMATNDRPGKVMWEKIFAMITMQSSSKINFCSIHLVWCVGNVWQVRNIKCAILEDCTWRYTNADLKTYLCLCLRIKIIYQRFRIVAAFWVMHTRDICNVSLQT